MRAVGFSKYEKKDLQKLLIDVILESTERYYTSIKEDASFAQFCKDFSENNLSQKNEDTSKGVIGIAVCGEFDNNEKFTYEYYFPYLKSTNISSEEDVSIERHSAHESYAGVCDDIRIGVSLIFYLQNVKIQDYCLLEELHLLFPLCL